MKITSERAAESSPGPKGRQHVASGVSPRKAVPPDPSKPRRVDSRPAPRKLLPPLRGFGEIPDPCSWGLRPRLHAAGPSGLENGITIDETRGSDPAGRPAPRRHG